MDNGTTRREFLTTLGLASAGFAFPSSPPSDKEKKEADLPVRGLQPAITRLTVNGKAMQLTLDSRTSLLDALREHLHLTGSKKGCDHGQCGACTVLLDGVRINSCLQLLAGCEGCEVISIEGLGRGEELHPMQAAFLRNDAFQCGYCTPGMILSSVGLLKKTPQPSVPEIRRALEGNVCRCGSYSRIVAAVQIAAGAPRA